MAIADNNGSANYDIKTIYDNDGSANHTIGKVYDNDGTTNHLIYTDEQQLYLNGDEFASITGGYVGSNWTSPSLTGHTGTATKYADHLGLGIDVYTNAMFRTNSMVSLAGFSTMRLNVNISYLYNPSQWFKFKVLANTTAYDLGTIVQNATGDVAGGVPALGEIYSTDTSSYTGNIDIDISHLTGSYYLSFVLFTRDYCADCNKYVDIYSITLL